jgi:hypothetical protein
MRLANAQKSVVAFVGAIADLNVTAFDDTTITLDWTMPSADNPIDYYEVYLNGVFYENTTDASEGWTITGLTAGTSYDITLKAVDDLGNKGAFSNEVTQSTTGGFDFATNMMAYWKLATNALDSSGKGHNGTATGITYSGGYAQFGSGKYIDVADSNDFSFTDGTNDLPAHFLFAFKWNSKTGTQIFISKRSATTTGREYEIFSNGTDFFLRLLNPTTPNAWIDVYFPISLISTGVLHTVQFSYDGSELHTGLRAYLDGNTSVGSTLAIGDPYTGQVNGSSNLRLGNAIWTSAPILADGKEWAIWKNRTMTGTEIQELHDRVIAGTPLI